mgnify:FL=1
MSDPRTAAEWAEEYSRRLNQDGEFVPERGEKLFPRKVDPLEWMLDAYARQQVEAVLTAHQAVVRELADLLDGVWLPLGRHPLWCRDRDKLLAYPLVVAARKEGRDAT